MSKAYFFHERLQRGEDLMGRAQEFRVTVCGAGALGANIIEGLARQGFVKLRVIDRDRVEERNLSTQPYYAADIGALKAKILANSLYRALGAKIDAKSEELIEANAAKLIGDAQLVVDAFDNSVARCLVKEQCERANIACLHAGLANGYAEIIWNEQYRVPSAAQDDICEYPLARNLVMLAVAVTCETIVRYVADAEKRSFTLTLDDFAVRPYNL